VTLNVPFHLEKAIFDYCPDAIHVDVTQHSSSVYTLLILDVDYSYDRALCCLSLDGRWTVSPRDRDAYNARKHKRDRGDW
jgi:hypothetical protein